MINFQNDDGGGLRHFRIGTRLILGFGAILLILVAMAGIDRVLNDQSKTKLLEGLKAAEAKSRLATKMKGALLEGGISLRNMGLTSDLDLLQKAQKTTEVERAVFVETRNNFVALGLTQVEKGIIDNITEIDKQLQAPVREATVQALAFNPEGAAKILTDRVDSLNQQMIKEINALVDNQQAAADEVLVRYNADDRKLKLLLLFSCVVAVVIGGVLAWIITLSIISPLREAVSFAKEVASGRLSSKFSVLGRDEVSELALAVKEMVRCLSIAYDKLRDLSRYDALTGVRNRGYFIERFDAEWRRAHRAKDVISLLMVDIDHFKNVNDCYGHPCGDVCLQHVANTIKQAMHRSGDEIFRYGGEEFVILLASTDLDGALHIAELIRHQVEILEFFYEGKKIPITVSIGAAATIPDSIASAQTLLGNADRALYEAKQSGRNKVCVHPMDR
ncbi:MAG TPA: diguanylate cyclase [Burkholderiaceae bacterium]|jgi:diguanylate cyclase (GGDEF)-like protein